MKQVFLTVLLLALPGTGQAHCWVRQSYHYGGPPGNSITVDFLRGAPAHLTVINTATGKIRNYTQIRSDNAYETTYRWDDEPQPSQGDFIVLNTGDTLAFEGEDHTTCHLAVKQTPLGLSVSGGSDTAPWTEFFPAAPPPPF